MTSCISVVLNSFQDLSVFCAVLLFLFKKFRMLNFNCHALQNVRFRTIIFVIPSEVLSTRNEVEESLVNLRFLPEFLGSK